MRGLGIVRWSTRLLLAAALAVCMGYIPYRVWGPEGIRRTLRLQSDLQRLTTQNRDLARDNAALRRQIRRLTNDRGYIEHVARDELGMVRPGDIVFQFKR